MRLISAYVFMIILSVGIIPVNAQKSTWEIVYKNYSDQNKPLGKLKTTVYVTDSMSVSLLQMDYYFELGKQILKNEPSNTDKVQTTSIYVRPEDTIKRYIYKDFIHNQLFFETNKSTIYPFFKTFSDSLHNMFWILNDEERKIDSFLCRQATCSFRGRYYTAWYATSIPLNNGPWKFGGLPGLILEISDSTKAVYWKVVSVKKEIFKFPSMPVITNGDFYDFKKEYNLRFQKIKKSFESTGEQNDPTCKDCKGVTKTIKSNTPEILIND